MGNKPADKTPDEQGEYDDLPGSMKLIMDVAGSPCYVPVPILGRTQQVHPNVIKNLQTQMGNDRLTLQSGGTVRPLKQLLTMIANVITSNGFNSEAAFQVITTVSRDSLATYIYNMAEEMDFAKAWVRLIRLLGNSQGKTSYESELTKLVNKKPESVAEVMTTIRSLCKKMIDASHPPERREVAMVSEALRYGRSLIKIHYPQERSQIFKMYEDQKEKRDRDMRKAAKQGRVFEDYYNDFDILTNVATGFVQQFLDDGDDTLVRHKVRGYSGKTEVDESDDESENETPDINGNVARTNQERYNKKGRDWKNKRDQENDPSKTNKDPQKNKKREDEKPAIDKDSLVLEIKQALLKDMEKNTPSIEQQNQAPRQVYFPTGHPTYVPGGRGFQGPGRPPQNANQPPFNPNYRNQGQNGYQSPYPQRREGAYVRVAGTPGAICYNCNIKGHIASQCFKYQQAPPGDVECPICKGRHKAECRARPRAIEQQLPSAQNERAMVPANPGTFGGIGNQGVQSMPAPYMNIQRRNAEPTNQIPLTQSGQQNRNIYGNVTRSEISYGSGYHYALQDFYNPSEVRTITDEELGEAAARGEIEVLYDDAEGEEGDGLSDVMLHHYDRE